RLVRQAGNHRQLHHATKPGTVTVAGKPTKTLGFVGTRRNPASRRPRSAHAMPSPFPGMDPYLEAQPYWSTLHANLFTAMQGELKRRVPRSYSVWSDVYIWLLE